MAINSLFIRTFYSSCLHTKHKRLEEQQVENMLDRDKTMRNIFREGRRCVRERGVSGKKEVWRHRRAIASGQRALIREQLQASGQCNSRDHNFPGFEKQNHLHRSERQTRPAFTGKVKNKRGIDWVFSHI